MGDLKTRLTIKALIGALAGIAICIFFYAIGAYDHILTNRPLFILQFVGSAVLGIVSMGGSIAYEIDSWGLTKATLVHYVVTLGTFVGISVLLGWFSETIALLIAFLVMTVMYFLIWLFNYAIWKREIRKINSDLNKMKQEEKDKKEGEHP